MLINPLCILKSKMNPYKFPWNFLVEAIPVLGEDQIRIDRVRVKASKNCVADFCKGFGLVSVILNISPYILPTAIKSNTDDTLTDLTYASGDPHAKREGSAMGYAAGIVGLVGQVAIYGHLAREGNLEYLLIPIATNLISLIYEKSRKSPKKV